MFGSEAADERPERVPPHGLTLVKAFCPRSLVDRGLTEARGDAFTGAEPLPPLVHDVTCVVGDIRGELTERGGKLSERSRSWVLLQSAGDVVCQTFDVVDRVRGIPVPEQPFDPLQRSGLSLDRDGVGLRPLDHLSQHGQPHGDMVPSPTRARLPGRCSAAGGVECRRRRIEDDLLLRLPSPVGASVSTSRARGLSSTVWTKAKQRPEGSGSRPSRWNEIRLLPRNRLKPALLSDANITAVHADIQRAVWQCIIRLDLARQLLCSSVPM